jgi:hypothetical protein
MTYQQAVEQAAAALTRGEDANWELARLTWENTQTRHKESDRATMAQWCEAIREASGRKFSEPTGKVYRAIWQEYGQEPIYTRPLWVDAYYAVNKSTGKTYEEARETIERKAIERITEIATPEQKREVAAQLLSDPEVADAVIEQPETRRAVYESLQRQEQRTEARHNTIRASDPVSNRLDREGALIDLEKLLRTFADQTRTLVAAIGDLPERSEGAMSPHLFLRQSFVAAEDALGSVRTLLETGTNDLDSFLKNVLSGGQ